MPSGKKARQQRRAAAAAAPPPVRSKGVGGARGARQASPRALQIAGGVVLVAVIAIVLGGVLSNGGGSGGGSGTVSSKDLDGLGTTGNATSPVALQGAPQANALFKGIPQKGLIVGKPTAPVEMEMFIDVQCPICKFYEINYLPTVVQKYIRTGKVQLHLQPWAFIGAQSFTGRYGVIAAGAQNKAFEYAKVLYDNQPDNSEGNGWLDGRMMASIAASVTGLDLQRWRTDVNSAGTKSVAGAVDKLATKIKVTGTPTVLVGRTNGPLRNVLTPQQIALNQSPTLQDTERGLDAALAKS